MSELLPGYSTLQDLNTDEYSEEDADLEAVRKMDTSSKEFYDTYGYPISRHIRTPLAADIVYLIMKPLEWLFVAVLYLFDEKPENRIVLQYLPYDHVRDGI